jgi:hypothetical protein
MASLHELIEKKKGLVQAAGEIRDRVYNDQGGDWRGDDTAKFDELTGQADKVTADIERWAKLEAAERSLADAEKPQGRRSEPPQPGAPPSLGKATPKDADLAIRGWLLAGSEEAEISEAHRSAAKRIGVNLGSKTIRVRLFGDQAPQVAYVGGEIGYRTDRALMAEWEKRAAMGVGSTTIGGYTVPDAPMGALEEALLGLRWDASGVDRAPHRQRRGSPDSDQRRHLEQGRHPRGEHAGDGTRADRRSARAPGVQVLQQVGARVRRVPAGHVDRRRRLHRPQAGAAHRPHPERPLHDRHRFIAAERRRDRGDVVERHGAAHGLHLRQHRRPDPLRRSRVPENGKFMLHDSALKMIRKVKVLQYSGDTVGAPLWVPGVNGSATRSSAIPT